MPETASTKDEGAACGIGAMAGGCTRRLAIAGGLAQLLPGTPLRAASPVYDWQPASIPPDTALSFVDRKGQALSLAAFRGKPILLNIWATWCIPCIVELPALDRLQRDFSKQLTVIALSVDRAGMPEVLKALRKLSIRRLGAYLDASGDVVPRLRIAGLPATVAISATGAFQYVRRGRVDWDDPAERAKIRALLNI